jgi:hypothetical protein
MESSVFGSKPIVAETCAAFDSFIGVLGFVSFDDEADAIPRDFVGNGDLRISMLLCVLGRSNRLDTCGLAMRRAGTESSKDEAFGLEVGLIAALPDRIGLLELPSRKPPSFPRRLGLFVGVTESLHRLKPSIVTTHERNAESKI